MRGKGWTGSLLLHTALLLVLMLLRLPVPQQPAAYHAISLLEAPEPAGEVQVETPGSPLSETASSPGEQAAEPGDLEGLPRARLGLRTIPSWVSGPPLPEVGSVDSESLGRSAGEIRRSIASAADLATARREATTLDTLLNAQRILAELAGEILADARDAPKAHRGWGDPTPFPGSIQELRGEPQMPLIPLAAAAAEVLVDLGKKAWDRLTRREGALSDGPDLDMTWEEAAAFGALREHHGVSIFEWHARMPTDWQGGITRLQEVAAGLAGRGIIRMGVEGEVFRYRRVMPVQDVIAYYTAFLTRLPPSERDLRAGLEAILAVLVRVP